MNARETNSAARGFEAVLSDMDGVLVDTSDQHHRVMRRWAQRHRLDPEDVIRATQGVRNRDFIRELAPGASVDRELDVIASWANTESHDVSALPGADELLRGVLTSAPTAVVTSSSAATARQRLAVAGLRTPLVLVTSENVIHGKPDPEGYFLAAKLLRVDITRCLVIEDSPAGLEAGVATGATVAALRTTHRDDELKGAHLVDESIAGVARQLGWSDANRR